MTQRPVRESALPADPSGGRFQRAASYFSTASVLARSNSAAERPASTDSQAQPRGQFPWSRNLARKPGPSCLPVNSLRPGQLGASASEAANSKLPCCKTAPPRRRWALPQIFDFADEHVALARAAGSKETARVGHAIRRRGLLRFREIVPSRVSVVWSSAARAAVAQPGFDAQAGQHVDQRRVHHVVQPRRVAEPPWRSSGTARL